MENPVDRAALERLAERIKTKPEPIDNSRLRAGSPMYYYCRLCGHLAATLPESHWDSPPRYCGECDDLKKVANLTDATLKQMVEELAADPHVGDR